MKKKLLSLVLSIAMIAMYGFSTAAFAASTNSGDAAGSTVKCQYYIHYVQDVSKIDFNACGSSGQSSSNYSNGVAGQIVVPAWTVESKDGVNKYFTTDNKGTALSSTYLAEVPSSLSTTAGIQALFDASKSKMGGKTVTVAKNAHVVWYVIKHHGDGYHVDGYVVASKVTYGLNYDSNTKDSVTSMPSNTSGYETGTTVKASETTPVRAGYVFKGWSTSANSTKTVDSVKFASENITLYAVWEKNYNLTYDSNTTDSVSSMPSDSNTYHSGDSATVSGTTPTREGYKFMGWSTTKNGTDIVDSSVTFDDSDITLYAVWSKDLSLKYDANVSENDTSVVDSSMPTDNNVYHSGDNATVSNATPLRLGYTFSGWSTTADGSNIISSDSLTFADSDITLYAVWTSNSGRNDNGGTVNNNPSNNNTSGSTTNGTTANTTSNSNSSSTTGTVTSGSTNNASQPYTGDDSVMMFWILLAIAGAGATAFVVKKHQN